MMLVGWLDYFGETLREIRPTWSGGDGEMADAFDARSLDFLMMSTRRATVCSVDDMRILAFRSCR